MGFIVLETISKMINNDFKFVFQVNLGADERNSTITTILLE